MRKKVMSMLSVLALAVVPGVVSAYTTEPSESLEVWLGPLTLENDGTTISTLTVYQKDDVDFTAFNMAIVVPEGVTVAKVKQGREWIDDIHLTDRASSTHTITCGMPDANTIKIISSSPSLSNYYPTTEDGVDPYALFTIGLVASPAVDTGEYQLELCDVKFVLESGDASVLPEEPLVFPMTVQGTPTGVGAVGAPADELRMYDLHGRPINTEPTEGIYIRNGKKVVAE